jgi:hypothetical protein
VDELSLWQFAVSVKGWNRAQGGEEQVEPLSPEEYDADMAKAAERGARLH